MLRQATNFSSDDHAPRPSISTSSRPAKGSGLSFIIKIPIPSSSQSTSSNVIKRKVSPVEYDNDVPVARKKRKGKPLHQLLPKLISQMKKRDPYGFFLQPVNAALVPGYAEMIQFPMDLGTMAKKVEKGKYTSLDQFGADFRLVTGNARTFNPPGSIYHSEAARLETWGQEAISKAAALLFDYEEEDDVKVDVEADEEPDDHGVHEGSVKEEYEEIGLGNYDDGETGERSVSYPPSTGTPSAAATAAAAQKKRRGPYRSATSTIDEEEMAPGGPLPGASMGVGAFPVGSDWANVTLGLATRGKVYRTKREKQRMERGGYPTLDDGSINYADLDDPFSLLSFFVPRKVTSPHLFPITPLRQSVATARAASLPLSRAQSVLPPHTSSAPIATIQRLSIGDISNPILPTSGNTPKQQPSKIWTITYGSTKKIEDDEEKEYTDPQPRPALAADYGAFAALPAMLAEQNEDIAVLADEDVLFERLRKDALAAISRELQSRERPAVAPGPSEPQKAGSLLEMGDEEQADWAGEQAVEAEAYVRDVVYGGLEGMAYMRSLAEFVAGPSSSDRFDDGVDDCDVKEEEETEGGLGMPLAEWVEENIVLPLTGGLHQVIRDVGRHLTAYAPSASPFPFPLSNASAMASHLHASFHTNPGLRRQLNRLSALRNEKVDMAAVLRAPEDFFIQEEKGDGEHALPMGNSIDISLKKSADQIIQLAGRTGSSNNVDVEEKGLSDAAALNSDEDPALRTLRLRILLLTKCAPLDQIAPIPTELVPPNIRHIFQPTKK
ncbi:hypothetical protein BOTBODRAFT_146615 [Botryobasidium botryosum FD-172 SS1]|uniref:Bromo domain-containing protein n=1 Tax=Botryobasidium botryosum (strain FD-172 SS1) TaxID=930990 RepID=A0A067MAK7_BOTB1|nr:hypothetical protein BOTBODRAFT_146615 [Botryobasidium botryosum FD-172 SS1]